MKKKILICEDDDGILGLCEMVLTDAGYEVTALDDSTNFFEVIRQNTPDLILIDLWMSGMSGDEIVIKVKKDERYKKIPVIIFSANNDVENISKLAGADGFLAKPFPISQLEDMVKKFLQHTKVK